MRISASELQGYVRRVPPSPPPVEPVLAPAEEARAIADRRRDDAVTHARRERVRALIRRPAAPEGADAELVVLLAVAKALPLEGEDDRLRARTRLAEIARLDPLPPAVAEIRERLRVRPGDSRAFADALLPARGDGTTPFTETPGIFAASS